MRAYYSTLCIPELSHSGRGSDRCGENRLATARSQFSQAAAISGKSTRTPITNSFASYRRAYNDYSNRYLRETSGASRYWRISGVLSGQTWWFGRRGRWNSEEDAIYPIPKHQPICGRRPRPLGKAYCRPLPSPCLLSLYLFSARRVDALTEKGEARVSRGMLFATLLRRRERSPAKSAAAIRGTCVSRLIPLSWRSSSSFSSGPAGRSRLFPLLPFLMVHLLVSRFTRLSFCIDSFDIDVGVPGSKDLERALK